MMFSEIEKICLLIFLKIAVDVIKVKYKIIINNIYNLILLIMSSV